MSGRPGCATCRHECARSRGARQSRGARTRDDADGTDEGRRVCDDLIRSGRDVEASGDSRILNKGDAGTSHTHARSTASARAAGHVRSAHVASLHHSMAGTANAGAANAGAANAGAANDVACSAGVERARRAKTRGEDAWRGTRWGARRRAGGRWHGVGALTVARACTACAAHAAARR